MSSSDWQEWVLETHSHLVEPLEDWFFHNGALAVSLEDNSNEPLLEPGPGETPLWTNIKVTALFAGDVDLSPIAQQLPIHLLAQDSKNDVLPLDDREWARVCMDEFVPIQMGPRLWICPSWSEPPEKDAVNVFLDPGLAFGTGTHATTAMCLKALDQSISKGARVVDFGCGSGILAIAALRLGAKSALGVDNDPQAITSSRDNAGRNHIDIDCFDVVLPGDPAIGQWQGSADLVVANILAGPLVALADELVALTKPGGDVMLTGVLEEQAVELMDCYRQINLVIAERRDGWVLLTGQKPA